jgi:hypothetical protein
MPDLPSPLLDRRPDLMAAYVDSILPTPAASAKRIGAIPLPQERISGRRCMGATAFSHLQHQNRSEAPQKINRS